MKCPRCKGTGEIELRTVGDLVLAFRTERGLSQEILARKSGVSRGQIANLETGRTDISMAALFRIAEALEISAKDLVPDDPLSTSNAL